MASQASDGGRPLPNVAPLALPWSLASRGTHATAGAGSSTGQTLAVQEATRQPATGVWQDQAGAASLAPKQGTAADLFNFIKGISLNFDPVKESECLWIVDDVMRMPLPPGWSEHDSPQGVFFYNNSESAWLHPNQAFLHEMVDTFRRVQKVGGFWGVDDELEGMEDKLREELSTWMELYDDKGQPFFYNEASQESRLDDPREQAYHRLYNKIQFVQKMKEKLPLLARAPRPEEPTPLMALDMLSQAEDERARFLENVVKIQCAVRVYLAKNRFRQERLKLFMRGSQPLRGLVKLSIEPKGGKRKREVRLASTAEHRRHRAAVRIQTAWRRYLAVKRVKPLIEHRRFLSKQACTIQRQVRPWAADKRNQRLRRQLQEDRALDIQRVWRGRQHRVHAAAVKKDHEDYVYLQKCVIRMQCLVRRFLARCELHRRREQRYNNAVSLAKTACQVFLAKQEVVTLHRMAEPVQARFTLTPSDAKEAGVLPWTFRLLMAPLTDDGEPLPEPNGVVDLFAKAGIRDAEAVAATRVQKVVRGNRRRAVRERAKEAALDAIFTASDAAVQRVRRRRRAATRVQALIRRFLVRCRDPLGKRRARWLDSIAGPVAEVQAILRRQLAQEKQVAVERLMKREWAATIIQAKWRMRIACRRVQYLRLEACWPHKAWLSFNDTPAGCAASSVEVKFMPNPRFDDWKFFDRFGDPNELKRALSAMNTEVSAYVDRYFSAEPVMADLDARIQVLENLVLKTPDDEKPEQAEAAVNRAQADEEQAIDKSPPCSGEEGGAAEEEVAAGEADALELEKVPSEASLRDADEADIDEQDSITSLVDRFPTKSSISEAHAIVAALTPAIDGFAMHDTAEDPMMGVLSAEFAPLEPVPEMPESPETTARPYVASDPGCDEPQEAEVAPSQEQEESTRATLPAAALEIDGSAKPNSALRARSGSPTASDMFISPSSPAGHGRSKRTPQPFDNVSEGPRRRADDKLKAQAVRNAVRSHSQPTMAPQTDGKLHTKEGRSRTAERAGPGAEVNLEKLMQPLPTQFQPQAAEARSEEPQQPPPEATAQAARAEASTPLVASPLVIESGSAGPEVLSSPLEGYTLVREAATAPTQVRAPGRNTMEPVRPLCDVMPEEHWHKAQPSATSSESASGSYRSQPSAPRPAPEQAVARRVSASSKDVESAMARLLGLTGGKPTEAEGKVDEAGSNQEPKDSQDRPPSSPPQKGRLLLLEELVASRSQALVPIAVAARRRHRVEGQKSQVADTVAEEPPADVDHLPEVAASHVPKKNAGKAAKRRHGSRSSSSEERTKEASGTSTKETSNEKATMRHTFPGQSPPPRRTLPKQQAPRATSSASARIRGQRQEASAALGVLKDAGIEFQAMSGSCKGTSSGSNSMTNHSGYLAEDSHDQKVEELVRRQQNAIATKTKLQQEEIDRLQDEDAHEKSAIAEQIRRKQLKMKQLKKLVKSDKRLPAAYQQAAGPWSTSFSRGVTTTRLLQRHVHHHMHFSEAGGRPPVLVNPGDLGGGGEFRSFSMNSLHSQFPEAWHPQPVVGPCSSMPNLKAAEALPPLAPCGARGHARPPPVRAL
mmetsp:Transcript_40692/g.93507  ORF Transcript_40692/g.93507 Transcript_40692/m.93507 type:complete len:1578 (-) Transcript_40692:49-4782(-)